MARKITRRQAEAVMALVDERWGAWYKDLPVDSPDRPQLVEDWEPWWGREDDEPVPFAILWESGPYEWAYRFSLGGLDEELAAELESELGRAKAAELIKPEEPAPDVKGVFAEPGTSFILCLYPHS